MEGLFRKWHHPPEDLRLKKSRFTVGSVLSAQSRLPRCLWISSHLWPPTGVFQRRLLLPPPQNEIRSLLQHAPGELLPRKARVTASKFACAAANPRYFQSICKLPREISVPPRIVTPVLAFHLTSHDKCVSWHFAVHITTHFTVIKMPLRSDASESFQSCLSYLNDNSREIIVKLIQYKYVLSRLSLEVWNIDRSASGRCFWLFLQHPSCLYSCAGIYGLSAALCFWNCDLRIA